LRFGEDLKGPLPVETAVEYAKICVEKVDVATAIPDSVCRGISAFTLLSCVLGYTAWAARHRDGPACS
jgi:hypothetical protein